MNDRLLTHIGIARALRSLAAITAGIHDWETAITWCHTQGYIVFTGNRGADGTPEFRLTQRGASIVWLFWKAYLTGRQINAGHDVDTAEWGQAEGKTGHIELQDPFLHETDPEPA